LNRYLPGRRQGLWLGFGKVKGQYPVVVSGSDALGLNAGEIKAAQKRTIPPLPPNIIILAFLVVFVLPGGDNQAVILYVNIDILLAEAGKLRVQLIGVALVYDIGSEILGAGKYIKLLSILSK